MITERIAESSKRGLLSGQNRVQVAAGRSEKPISSEQWAEIAAGKRKPDLIVHNRMSWDCSLVELIPDLDDRFFILPFPPGGSKSMIWTRGKSSAPGRSNRGRGRPAGTAWTIGRWVDGQERTLEGLRGQVVVLDFWSGGFGKNFEIRMPHLKTLMDRFAGQPVTFITIHLAERDRRRWRQRSSSLRSGTKFPYIAAIDAGRMAEDSVNWRREYGVGRCIDRVIIGRDGKIAYVDPEVRGPACSRSRSQNPRRVQAEFDRHWQERFEAVGVRWRPSKWLGSIKKFFLCQKVETLYIGQQIEKGRRRGTLMPRDSEEKTMLTRLSVLICLLVTCWPAVLAADELPTAESIVKTYGANKQRLSRLHLRFCGATKRLKPGAARIRKNSTKRRIAQELAATGVVEVTINGANVHAGGDRPEIAAFTGQDESDGGRVAELAPIRNGILTPMEFFVWDGDYQIAVADDWQVLHGAARRLEVCRARITRKRC